MRFLEAFLGPSMVTEPSEITLALPRCSIEEPGDAIRAGREHLPPGRSRMDFFMGFF